MFHLNGKARHTHTDSSVANVMATTFFSWQLKCRRYVYVLHQQLATLLWTCRRVAFYKSVGHWVVANYLSAEKKYKKYMAGLKTVIHI